MIPKVSLLQIVWPRVAATAGLAIGLVVGISIIEVGDAFVALRLAATGMLSAVVLFAWAMNAQSGFGSWFGYGWRFFVCWFVVHIIADTVCGGSTLTS
jgi:hypothetical protein